MGLKNNTARTAWRLIKGYWTSDEKWSASGLLAAILGMNLANVFVSVRINEWNRTFYNALVAFDRASLFAQLGYFCILVTLAITLSVYGLYLNQLLQIRWRRWLTGRYLDSWLQGAAYYRLESTSKTDNPDQRITEDVQQFTSFILNLSIGLISSIASLASFLVILWGLSGDAEIPIGNWVTLHIPGYLVWAALLYAGIGTYWTIKIGRPLVCLNYARQRFEADLRFSLVRFRENAESVAFCRGEPFERRLFKERFGSIFDNFRQLMKRQRNLSCFTLGYAQVAVVFPLVVLAPRYFLRQIGLGGLMQAGNAFSFVQNSLSFFINSYSDIAAWQAVTARLGSFEERLQSIHNKSHSSRRISVRRGVSGVQFKRVDVDMPDGSALLRGLNFASVPHGALLITGPGGVGKSTLLRAAAGIWPYGKGVIRISSSPPLFVPQKPYLPLGNLADVLNYPNAGESIASVPPNLLASVLQQVGLGALVPELETPDQNWSQRLSAGEQQRLSFARILLLRPALIFLDEATSALDEEAEAALYGLLRSAAWRPTIVTVAHRSSLRQYHDAVVDLSEFSVACKSEILVPEVFTNPMPPFVPAPLPRAG